ncbi:MAG: HAD family phosphatase [Firmicutes bacterium]|nr:HAD family phosphatase [Bacillota bacterium]
MGYKLVALDLDGTVLTYDEILKPRVRQAIKNVQRKGIYVTIATGRRYARTIPWARALGIQIPIVVIDGAVVADPVSEQSTLLNSFSLDVGQSIIAELEQAQLPYLVYPGEDHGEAILMKRENWLNSRSLVYRYLQESVKTVEKLSANRSYVKIATIGDTKIIQPYLKHWEEKYSNELVMNVFSSPTQQHLGVEFLAKDCSKASGIQYVIDSLSISFKEVVAIGDGINDIELLKSAGFGVAMLNAPQEVREVASYVTGSVEESGVAQVLEELF